MFLVSDSFYGSLHFRRHYPGAGSIYPVSYIHGGMAVESSNPFLDIFSQSVALEQFSLYHCMFQVHEDCVLQVQTAEHWFGCMLMLKGHLIIDRNEKRIKFMQGQVWLGDVPPVGNMLHLKKDHVYEMLIIRLFRGLSTQFITIPHPVEKPVWGHYKIPELAAQLIKYPHQNNQLAELMKLVTHVTSDATAKLFPVNERQVDNLFYVREQMKQALQKKTGLKTWASQAQMNLTTFKYLFSQVFGVTPYNYLLEIRLEASKKMAAEEPYLSLKTVAERCGFNTYDNLRRTFYAKEKMTFTAWRKLKGLLQMLITSEILDACWL